MEAKLNIANILKDKPSGTKLYADAFGELSLERVNKVVRVNEVVSIFAKTKISTSFSFYDNGKYTKEGEPILVPSKKMRDWSKFAWKTGDILVSDDGKSHIIFSRWYDDNYTSFYGKHYLNSEDKNKIVYYEEFLCATARYSLENRDATQTYINTIEERLGGKLNRETLEIEKQPEFKDGDILYAEKDESHIDAIFILEIVKEERGYYACLILHPYMVCKYSCGVVGNKTLRYATEEEKRQLFDALAKEGKVWNAEKKQIVDLKPKVELKPFDKVVVRCSKADKWSIDFFSYKVSNGYICTGDAWFGYCLPYNEETAHLLGTTNEWKGGDYD